MLKVVLTSYNPKITPPIPIHLVITSSAWNVDQFPHTCMNTHLRMSLRAHLSLSQRRIPHRKRITPRSCVIKGASTTHIGGDLALCFPYAFQDFLLFFFFFFPVVLQEWALLHPSICPSVLTLFVAHTTNHSGRQMHFVFAPWLLSSSRRCAGRVCWCDKVF